MYDYATITKQNEIISEIQSLASTVENFQDIVHDALILIAVLIVMIFLGRFLHTIFYGR